MSLHNGIDTVGIISGGAFTKTYTSSAPGNIASLFASRGLLEEAPNIAIKIINIIMYHFRKRRS